MGSRIKRWNMLAIDPLGNAVLADSFWTKRGAANEARYYNELRGFEVQTDEGTIPLIRYEIERSV